MLLKAIKSFVILFFFAGLLANTGIAGSPSKETIETKKYLENALSSAQKGSLLESKDWLAKLEQLKKVDLEAVFSCLNDNKENVQFCCYLIETIGNIGNKKSTKLLMGLLEKEKNDEIKLSLIESLGKLKDKKAVELLKKYLQDESWGIRVFTSFALENITGYKYSQEIAPEQ